jgi:transposase
MLTLPPSTKIFLCSQPVDMRQSFDGLSGLVRDGLRQDTFSGHLFVFFSRCKSKVKILYWDRDGYVIWYKRLEHGRFLVDDWLQGRTDGGIEVAATEFAMLLGGLNSKQIQRQKRYSREPVLAGPSKR